MKHKIIITTGEERLDELEENIERAEGVLRETKKELCCLRQEYRTLLHKMYPRGEMFYQSNTNRRR